MWGASPNSLYAVRHLIQYSNLQRAQLLRRLQTELKRRTCIVSHLSLACVPIFLSILPSYGCLGRPLRTGCLGPKIAPNVFLRCLYFSICVVSTGLGTSHWPPLSPMCFYTDCTSPFVLSPLVLVLHTGPRKGNCVSPFVCLINALCILLSFLWLLWDEGFLVFPIPPSVTALGQFSFRQVSPLGSPFVSLLVAALRRRNSYVFHVSNDIIRCPLWPQCY